MMNKNNKNNLDELQEKKLLKIEHNCAWFAFWALLISIAVQTVIGCEFKYMMGEWLIFMCIAVYMSVACLKNGIWERKSKPNLKTNIITSGVAGIVTGVLFGVSSFIKYDKLLGSIATGVIMLIMISVVTFCALSVSATLYKKRVEKLESEIEE